MTPRHIVLVTQIPLWSMGKAVGGPSFHNTLKALGQEYRVSLVTPRLGYVKPEDLPPGVELYEFKHTLHGLFRQVKKLGWIMDTLGWYTFRTAAWPIVRRLCAKGDVDLLYGYEIYGVPVAKRAARRFGLPLVARYQGTLMSYRRHERLAGLRYHKHLAALKTEADLYVMTDDGTMGDEVLEYLGHPAEKTLFLMNGVDRTIVKPQGPDVRESLGVPPETPLLLTVSRLMLWKRVDRAILTFAELVRRGSSAHLAIVGVGPLEQRLRDLAASEGVADRTHFIGGVSRDELADFFRSATLFLSVNDCTNLVNPVIEAMLLGCPVAALDVGDTDHLMHNDVNGVLLPSEDPADIADAVERLMSDPADLAERGRRGADWAQENLWSWDARMGVELDAIEALLSQRN